MHSPSDCSLQTHAWAVNSDRRAIISIQTAAWRTTRRYSSNFDCTCPSSLNAITSHVPKKVDWSWSMKSTASVRSVWEIWCVRQRPPRSYQLQSLFENPRICDVFRNETGIVFVLIHSAFVFVVLYSIVYVSHVLSRCI